MPYNEAMKRLLPIGIQDFVGIREGGYIYVDKTARIYELISSSGKAFFLSRPRRFGKSLLCSTMRAIFEGRRELFGEIKGLPPKPCGTTPARRRRSGKKPSPYLTGSTVPLPEAR